MNTDNVSFVETTIYILISAKFLKWHHNFRSDIMEFNLLNKVFTYKNVINSITDLFCINQNNKIRKSGLITKRSLYIIEQSKKILYIIKSSYMVFNNWDRSMYIFKTLTYKYSVLHEQTNLSICDGGENYSNLIE